MKLKLSLICLIATLLLPLNVVGGESATLKDGTILYSAGYHLAGEPIPLGVDPYGYNYQAHKFDGSYFNAYANSANLPPYNGDDTTYCLENPGAKNHWAWPYRNVTLAMKWNDSWLSNKDMDGDGKLDRPTPYKGSGAWITNHMSETYTIDGKDYFWNYFVKIVAVPDSATKPSGVWFGENGNEIGPDIWNEFAVIQEIYNDTGTGDHGPTYLSPSAPGLGGW